MLSNLKPQTSHTKAGQESICNPKPKPCLPGLTQKFLNLKWDCLFCNITWVPPELISSLQDILILPNHYSVPTSHNKLWHLFFQKHFLAVQTPAKLTWSQPVSPLFFPLHHLPPAFRRPPIYQLQPFQRISTSQGYHNFPLLAYRFFLFRSIWPPLSTIPLRTDWGKRLWSSQMDMLILTEQTSAQTTASISSYFLLLCPYLFPTNSNWVSKFSQLTQGKPLFGKE